MSIDIGGYTIVPSNTIVSRRTTWLLWGKSGCGKTTLATTLPSERILWINFDANGAAALSAFDHVDIIDLSSAPDSVVEQFKDRNSPLLRGLEKQLIERQDWKAIVFDSLTTFADKALVHGVAMAAKNPRGKERATLENPGLTGYGNKYTWMRVAVQHMLELSGKYDRHMCFIAHEDTPNKNREGAVVSYDILIGSNLSQVTPINLAECWHITDLGEKEPRRVAVRPCRLRSPMKTLMFQTDGNVEFPWRYDPKTNYGIKDWYKAWQENSCRKIPLPK